MKRWGIKDEISLAAMHLLRIVISAVVMAIVLGIGGALAVLAIWFWNWCAALLK